MGQRQTTDLNNMEEEKVEYNDIEKKNVCCGRCHINGEAVLHWGNLLLCLAMVVAGITLRRLPETELSYVCGEEPPTTEDIKLYPSCRMFPNTNHDSQIVPNSTRLLPVEESLCLQRGAADPSSTPVWCNTIPSQSSSSAWYLYWSSCEIRGIAWRIFNEPKQDESWFKQPQDVPYKT